MPSSSANAQGSTPRELSEMSRQQLEQSVVEFEKKLLDMKVLEDFTSTLMHFSQGVEEILWDVARLAVSRRSISR